jgi:hypothetical protein
MKNRSIQTEKIIFLGSTPITTTTSTTSSTTTGLPPAPTTTSTTTGTTTPTTTTTTTTSLTCCSNWVGDSIFPIFGGWASGCEVSNFVLNPVILNLANLPECKIYVLPESLWYLGHHYQNFYFYRHYPSQGQGDFSVFAVAGTNDIEASSTLTIRDGDIIYGTCSWNGTYSAGSDYDLNAYIYCP